MTVRPAGRPWAVRPYGELVCDCDFETVVQLEEDADEFDDQDRPIHWSGCGTGDCSTCGQVYADWWEGTFKLGKPQAEGAIGDGLSDDATQPADEGMS